MTVFSILIRERQGTIVFLVADYLAITNQPRQQSQQMHQKNVDYDSHFQGFLFVTKQLVFTFFLLIITHIQGKKREMESVCVCEREREGERGRE